MEAEVISRLIAESKQDIGVESFVFKMMTMANGTKYLYDHHVKYFIEHIRKNHSCSATDEEIIALFTRAWNISSFIYHDNRRLF